MEYVEPLSLESVLPKIWGDIKEMWPELVGIDGLYVTGGQVWRRYYGVGESKDTDFVAVTPEALKEAEDILKDEHSEYTEDHCGDNEPYMTPLGGTTYFTKRGRVDLWEDTDVRTTLRRYSDERSHARMAIHMKNGIFIKLPNAVERKPGEKYIVTNPDGSVTWRIE